MRIASTMLLSSAGIAVAALWTGCTCDPVYPPNAGERCLSEGDKECDLDLDASESLNVLICAETLQWVVETPCDDFGMVCREEEEGPMCVEFPCDEGQTRCTPDYTQIAVCNAAGEWTPSEVCDKGRVCAVQDGAAACVISTCDEGTTRCSVDAKQVEACDAEGEWVVTETCPPGQTCEVRVAVAICADSERICSAGTELDQRCDPEDPLWIQACMNVGTGEDPMYAWVDTEDCSTMSPDYVCQQVDDNAPFCFPLP